jgi:phage terminase large subunit-like protein
MPDPLPPVPPGQALDAWRNWKPEHQARALELLKDTQRKAWRPFYCTLPGCDGSPHGDWAWHHARPEQRPPRWWADWLTFCVKGGRGGGKTRTCSEITHRVTGLTGRIALVAATGWDLRETVVEGESGLLATAPPGQAPQWEPSKKKLTWPNGAIAQGFSAEEPDRLRGPQFGFAWLDEPAHFDLVTDVWDTLLLALRLGRAPKVVCSTTPLPTKWMKALVADPLTVTSNPTTYSNLANLADTFAAQILTRYEGTRKGRQELYGEILPDIAGALWRYDMLAWVPEPPPLDRIVIGVDPAGTKNKRSDETGIVAVGAAGRNLYILADVSGKYSPAEWAGAAHRLAASLLADAIVAEKNYGGDMVRHTLANSGHDGVRVKDVTSRRGKEIRAEPIVALFEQGRVFLVGKPGAMEALEDEMCTWVPGKGASPNRVDALVHAATELNRYGAPASIASAATVLAHLSSPTNRHLHAVG